MALNKQIHIYSVDTSAFYNESEKKIHDKMNKYYLFRKKINERIARYDKKINNKSNNTKMNYDLLKSIGEYTLKNVNNSIKVLKEKLCQEFKITKDKGETRKLNTDYLVSKNIISVFESSLTRVMGVNTNELTDNIIIVQTYFFDVIEDIILNGFIYNNEKFICYTASAGQIRTKKTVFIKENIWNKYKDTITCGLSIEKINELGGVNINKYLAYLALANSATDLWEDFDIDKAIVVNDFETDVETKVDFINDEDYTIKRQTMKVPISHTDGCGMILFSRSKKAFMTRIPWVKGLLEPWAFDEFIKEKSKELGKYCGIVEDIYGKEHDILKEGIEVIFTKSQFKMYKYYPNIVDKDGNIIKYGWDTYKENYKKYNCQAGKCNEEEDKIKNAKINYQMMQTLTDITNIELEKICEKTNKDIKNIGSNKYTMLKILGVTKENTTKNNIQQALEIYPELLNDTYCKEILKQVKKSMVKDAKAAKVSIDGKYTFISPDLYAFCEYLFLDIKEPNGLLKKDEVYCNLYRDIKELDCLRSPHLYREHAIRKNTIDDEKDKWFITKSLYTSCHDVISKILQFDVDGDKSLVCAEKTLVEVAKRDMEGILPLYYNMRKADAVHVDKYSIFNGLKTAYTGGNIGMYSNDISKIWNHENVNLDAIKLLCMENNFTIDYAKTLYKPIRPKKIKGLISDYTKLKTPHFFIYAKDKTKDKVENINGSVVNRMSKIIKNPPIKFTSTDLGKFNYKMLMFNKKVEMNEDNDDIIKKYKELDLKSHFMINKKEDNDKTKNITYLYQDIRKKILEVNNDEKYVTDVLIEYLYNDKKSNYKTMLWECFGDIIIENLKTNLTKNFKGKVIHCEECGILIEQASNKTKYCEVCSKKIKQKQKNKWKREKWNKINKEEK